MRIRSVSLQQFRNIELARLDFGDAETVFFKGNNGQGKSNMLEALSLITAVRSFRSSDLAPMIQHKHREARLIFAVEAKGGHSCEIQITLRTGKRVVSVDGSEIRQLQDYLGNFPSVVFSSDDIHLVKGSPQMRRRFFDLMLSTLDNTYLQQLQHYHKTLKARNAALRNKLPKSAVSAFDPQLSSYGLSLVNTRRHWMTRLSPLFEQIYLNLSAQEDCSLTYRPNLSMESEEGFLQKLHANYERDTVIGNTGYGPHRDDYIISVNEHGARNFGSDGQQRSLVLALKLAQMRLIRSSLDLHPVLLLDDILGELDDVRKSHFWNLLDSESQVFASGTKVPELLKASGRLRIYTVANGCFHLIDQACK